MQRLSIAIAGAGTAGLAVAAFLARDGHDVRVFEKFETARPLGAGLMLQPTGLSVLSALGALPAARVLGREMHGIVGRTLAGRPIFDLRYNALGPACHGLAMHRSALFEVLHQTVQSSAVPLHCSVDVHASDLERDKRSLIDGAGNRHGPFDLVIDATGTRSPLRDGLASVRFNHPYPYGALWAAVEEPPDWPTPNLLTQRYDGAHTMMGLLPIGRQPGPGRALTAFFWSLPVADYDHWRSTPFEAWRARVMSLWPATAPFLDQLRGHGDLTMARYSDLLVDPPFAERIAFVGDAARSASPQLGQGANLALLDANALAASLSVSSTVAAALAAYADARRRHTRFYSLASRLLTPFFQSRSRLAGIARDLAFRPLARVPYIEREMVRTLAGMKTGLFSHLDL